MDTQTDAHTKFGYLGCSFGSLGALRDVPGVTNRHCTTSGRWEGRTNQKYLKFGLKGAVALAHEKTAEPHLGIFLVFLVALGLWGMSLGWRIGDAPLHGGSRVGKIRKSCLMGWYLFTHETSPQIYNNASDILQRLKERLLKKDCRGKIVKEILWKKDYGRNIVRERSWKKDWKKDCKRQIERPNESEKWKEKACRGMKSHFDHFTPFLMS